MTTIQIELCQEDRARLDAIIKALERNVATAGTTTQPEEKKPTQAQIQSISTPVTGEELPWEEPKKEKAYMPDIEDIRRLAMTLSDNGEKGKAREIVQRYAKSIPAINSADYPAVYKELKQALKGE